MELPHFLKNITNSLLESEKSVFIFQGSTYSQLFFTQLYKSIKNEIPCDIKTIDIQVSDFSFKSQLSTSFLGMDCVYWLADASSLKIKQKNELVSFLISYEGPHKVIIFFDSKTKLPKQENISIVSLKDRYFLDDTKVLWMTDDVKKAQKNATFIRDIYKIKNSYSLDELFLLKNYQDVVSLDIKNFYESWIARLVVPDTSLFLLSQLLFEKKEKSFFELWLKIKSLYSEMFWIAFWSDQLYKSYFFIAYNQEKNYIAVKQVSFGLSFSFMKQSWKQYQLNEIKSFHHALYAIDTSLKNGGNSYQIDKLYIQFFTGNFKK